MKKTRNFIFLMLFPVFFAACEKDRIEDMPAASVHFDIERSNSTDDYSETVTNVLRPAQKISRFRYGTDSVMIIREIQFNLRLSNGDSLDFGFWMIAYESPELLILGEYDAKYHHGEEWDYLSYDTEVSDFYKGFREARILVNSNVIFIDSPQNDKFEIVRAEEVFIDGKFKTYLEIEFEGEAYGWYDPLGMYQEVYRITNGVFKGFLE